MILHTCPKCRIECPRTLEFFHPAPISEHWSGTYSICRKCKNKDKAYWVILNRDHHNAGQRRRRSENLERYRDYDHKRLSSKLAYQLVWRRRNPEHVRELDRARYQRDRDKRIAAVTLRHVRLINTEGYYTENDVQRLWWFQKGCCQYCGTQLGKNYHVDHMVPLSRGGSNWPRNLCLTCPFCNLSKNRKTAEEFYLEMEQVA